MPDDKDDKDEKTQRPHGFWYGSIVFGLVSVPVSLFIANRSSRISLRMVDEDGVLLNRRYFCDKDKRALEADDIVRGYEVEKDRYVVLEDDELDAIAPEKSQEINLEQFVDIAEIDPARFQRAYVLAPGKGGGTPYRLLARVMEDTGRAGIATFVMRGKQYLVAVVADNGILRAETMRFHDELRTPDDLGMAKAAKPGAKCTREIEKAVRSLQAKKPDSKALEDRYAARLEKLVKQKLRKDEDVYRAPEEAEPSERPSAEVIDLMQVLKSRLRGRKASSKKPAGRRSASAQRGKLEDRSKTELYDRAKELHIAGRSKMNRQQLVQAIRGNQ